jgi:hypothetical protein
MRRAAPGWHAAPCGVPRRDGVLPSGGLIAACDARLMRRRMITVDFAAGRCAADGGELCAVLRHPPSFVESDSMPRLSLNACG